jgi:hypothetical protein
MFSLLRQARLERGLARVRIFPLYTRRRSHQNHRRSQPLRRGRPTCPRSSSSVALAGSQRFVPQRATKNTSRRHSALCQKASHHGVRPLVVIPSPPPIIRPLPLIRMAVSPRRTREYCHARLMNHFSSSSGVKDYLASHLFFQPHLQQLPS